MKLWAFATSPHGLGLSPAAFWACTRPELDELIAVRQEELKRWAIGLAQQANIHQRGKDDPPFLPEDFLGTADRQERINQAARSRMEAMAANSKLMRIRRGEEPSPDVPAWAIGPKHELKPKQHR